MRYHIHHLHMPGHNFVLKIEHLLCDKYFWLAVGIIVLVAVFFALAVWAGQGQGGGIIRFGPMYPHLP